MANLTFNEKQLIEFVFGMSSGYVLDFSNREFEEFMKDVVQYSVYSKYPGLSKAKILRAFIKDESESYVGKAIILLINYMNDSNLVSSEKKEKVIKLYELGKKLLGKDNNQTIRKKPNPRPQKDLEIDFESLKLALLEIEKISNPQAKGYAFEKYLNRFFNAFGLEPHASYRTEYDQIDGSFVIDGNTILIEAKYRANQIPKDDLILFSNKIGLKSHFVKGLFITYSLVDKKTVDYFTDKSSRFVVLTVEELYLMCEQRISLLRVLHGKYRSLDEKGLIYSHLMSL